MSRSNNTEIKNPSKYYFEWVGSKGHLRYWDKSVGDKGANIDVPLPFNFLVLDRLACISGFSEADNSGYYSNEIRDTRTDMLTVKTKKGVVDHGLYKSLKCLAKGAQYCQSIYIAFKDGGEYVIANLRLSGSAIGPWIDILKGRDIYKYGVSITEALPKVKGATHYFEPVFKLSENITPETEAKAVELDKVLQEYLSAYFKNNNAGRAESKQEIVEPDDVVTEKQRADIKNLDPEDVSEMSYSPIDNEPADDLPF